MLGNDALLGFTGRFFRGGNTSAFAQNIHSGREIAFGFDQRFFAIHQACAGGFAQLADVGGGKFSHVSIIC